MDYCRRCGVEINSYVSTYPYCQTCEPNIIKGDDKPTVESIIQFASKEIDRRNSILPCTENQIAIQMLEAALFWLNERTRKRKEQGVEGTNKPHSS